MRLLILVCFLSVSVVSGEESSPKAQSPAPATQSAAPLAVPPSTLGVTQVKTAYLLPMRAGLDQYLANHLNQNGALQVVTDPARADVVITDALGTAFEKKLDELYPADSTAAKAAREESGDDAEAKPATAFRGDSMPRLGGFRGGRGNIFMVDPRAQGVVWSTFIRPRSTTAMDLDKAAREVVKRFSQTLKKSDASH